MAWKSEDLGVISSSHTKPGAVYTLVTSALERQTGGSLGSDSQPKTVRYPVSKSRLMVPKEQYLRVVSRVYWYTMHIHMNMYANMHTHTYMHK